MTRKPRSNVGKSDPGSRRLTFGMAGSRDQLTEMPAQFIRCGAARNMIDYEREATVPLSATLTKFAHDGTVIDVGTVKPWARGKHQPLER